MRPQKNRRPSARKRPAFCRPTRLQAARIDTRNGRRIALGVCTALALLAVGCREEPLPAVKPPEPESVSLEQIVSTPDRFDGVLVRVSGVARVEFEGNALYLTRESFERRDHPGALWLNLGWPVSKEILLLNGEEVLVDARVDAADRGNMRAFAATLTDIQHITRFLK
jgi:hypothetical protein